MGGGVGEGGTLMVFVPAVDCSAICVMSGSYGTLPK